MIVIAWIAVAFLLARLLVATVNLLTRPILAPGKPDSHPLVSVLIPARNEQDNIGDLLEDLLRQSYHNLEIIVYDDLSEDATAAVAETYQGRDSRVRLVRGISLPAGWLGKNHACHYLAGEASGEYLLFLDADVRITPDLVTHSVACLRRDRLQLLSIFPVQKMGSFGELAVVPLINQVLLSLLPLRLIRSTRIPSLSAANGQFMLFEGSAYRDIQPHSRMKDSRVEDIGIIRLFKRLDQRCQTLLSNGQILCRMYRGYGESIAGFSKNIHAFFGNSWLLLMLYGLLTAIGPVFILLAFPWPVSVSFFAGIVALRLMVTFLSRQPLLWNLFLIPMHQVSLWLIIIKGAYHQLTRSLTWKGRMVTK